MATNSTSVSDNVFGAAIVRNGKRWQASVETKDGQWTPYCDGKTMQLALASALARVEDSLIPAPRKPARCDETDDMDFG